MSVDLFVTLDRKLMPTAARWEEAIAARGFDMSLDGGFDPLEHEGFLPCTLEGRSTGFEYLVDDEDGFRVIFTTHSDLVELASAHVAAAVLADMTCGMLEDPQDGSTYEGEAALDLARGVVVEALGGEQKPSTPPPKQPLPPASGRPSRKPWWKLW